MSDVIKIFPIRIDYKYLKTVIDTKEIRYDTVGFFVSLHGLMSELNKDDVIILDNVLQKMSIKYKIITGVFNYTKEQFRQIYDILEGDIYINFLYKPDYIEYLLPRKRPKASILIYDENRKVVEQNEKELNKYNFNIEIADNRQNFEINREEYDFSLEYSYLYQAYNKELIISFEPRYILVSFNINPAIMDSDIFYKYLTRSYKNLVIDAERLRDRHLDSMPSALMPLQKLGINLYVINLEHEATKKTFIKNNINIIKNKDELKNLPNTYELNISSITKYIQLISPKILSAVLDTLQWFFYTSYEVKEAKIQTFDHNSLDDLDDKDIDLVLFGKITGDINMSVVMLVDHNLYYKEISKLTNNKSIKEVSFVLTKAVTMKMAKYIYNDLNTKHRIYSISNSITYKKSVILDVFEGKSLIKVDLKSLKYGNMTIIITG